MTSSLRKIRTFLQEETAYCAILSALVLFHAFSSIFITLHSPGGVISSQRDPSASKNLENSIDPQKIQEVLSKHSHLKSLLGVLLLFFIITLGVGIFLNLWFWSKQKRGGWRCPWRFPLPPPTWGGRDVFRVCVLLVFIAYLVEVGQGLFFLLGKFNLPEQARLMMNTAFLDLVASGLVLYWVCVYKSQTLRGLGLSATHFSRNLLVGLSGYTALLPLLALALLLSVCLAELVHMKSPEQPLYDIFFGPSSRKVMGAAVVLVIVIGPLVEEIFFRGFLYNALKRHWGKKWAMLTSGAFFALLHANWVGFLPITLLGVALAYLYEATGTLVASVTVHMIHNALVMGLVFLIRDLLQKIAAG